MSQIEFFQRLYTYETWAIRRSIQSLTPEVDALDSRPRLWLAHIVEARRFWFERLHGRAPQGTVFPDWPLDRIPREFETSLHGWDVYTQSLSESELARLCVYHNTAGIRYERLVHTILTHLMLHGQHHRGQVAAAVRAAGATPAATDFIYFEE